MSIEQSVAENLVSVVAIVGGLLFVLLTVVFKSWQQVQISHHQTELKEQLLAKGMSPDEIVKVINAGQGKSC